MEPDPEHRDVLQRTAAVYANAEAVPDFQQAYARLSEGGVDLLVTNLRLHSNVEGLQLAYVVASGGYPTRAIVYGEHLEPWVLRELQRAGAFYESRLRVPFALPAYIRASLPILDRRNPIVADRRTGGYRGGRRASDIPMVPRRLHG